MFEDDDNEGGGKDCEVGYGRPPKHSQFQKGQSGNPRGRRKGSRGLKADLDAALKATMTISVGGKKLRGTTQALSTQTLAMKSGAGDLRAQKHLHDLTLTVFGPGDRGASEEKLSTHDQILLDRLLDRFEPERSRAGRKSQLDSARSQSRSKPGPA